MRKPQPSPLDDYTEQLDQWIFEENKTYRECLELLSSLGLSSSLGALSQWRKRRSGERLLERIADNAQLANTAAEKFSQENPQLDRAFTNLLKQQAFQLVSAPNADPQAIFFVVSQALKLRDQDLKAKDGEVKERTAEQRQELLRLKAEELKVKQRLATVAEMKIGELLLKAAKDVRAQEIAGMDCSNEEKIRLLREHYFADVDALEKSGAVQLPPLS